ncbi:HAMP domain-containing histidine kinase [bacterium]|nr:MAG: HAMP domain-containing histidine kinase [bacterium]
MRLEFQAMVGRAVTGTLVLLTYAFAPSGYHSALAIPLGLLAFAADLGFWAALRLVRKASGMAALALVSTIVDLVLVAAVAAAALVPLVALPLLVMLPMEELTVRYHTDGAIAGVLYAIALIGYAVLHQGGPLLPATLVAIAWLLTLLLVLGGVRGVVASFNEWRASKLLERGERNAAMAGQLSTLLELSREILGQHDVNDVLSSIAVGVSKVFGFKYVSICFQRGPDGDFERRVLWGLPSEIVAERSGEIIDRQSITEMLARAHEIVEFCYYTPAENYVTFKNEIYVGDLPRHAPRSRPGAWHERDSMVLVMTGYRHEIIGYMSVDGPHDGLVPSHETMASMQIFVNMAGMAIINAEHSIRESERARTEEDARRLQMEFLSDVSHEIRAPLATIQGASSLLESHGEELEPARRREFLAALRDASDGLARMVDDLLLLSKLEAGHFRLFPEPIDLMAAVRDVVRSILTEHPGAPISLSLPSEPMRPVWADSGRLQQIVVNLLSNALKYSPSQTPIDVEVQADPQAAVIRVIDQGPGIPEYERSKLFTRFGRLSNAKADSTGLGLYISKGLAQAMEGDLDVDSEPGAGTTFYLTLRYADTKAEPRIAETTDGTRSDHPGGLA